MYSVVLMAALSAGAEAPDCWWHHRAAYAAAGCYGCSGGAGCWGSYYGGYGRYGGGYGGCYGGCWSSSYYGGCWGSCFGSSCYGGYGSCYGGCFGGCYGSSAAPIIIMPGAPGTGTETAPLPKKDDKPPESTSQAKLILDVPADAKLYIDDQLMKTTAPRRVFNTPALEPGQVYYYEVRVELVRDGRKYSEMKRVLVKAGEEVRESFAGLDKRNDGVVTVDARDRR